jgi:hypothetical protein
LVVAVLRIELRLATPVLVRRSLADLLVALRPFGDVDFLRVDADFVRPGADADFLWPLADADFLPSAGPLALPRLLPVALLAALFLFDWRFGFCGSPVRVSTKAVMALFATSTAAFTFAFAASLIACSAPGVTALSLSLSIITSNLMLPKRHTESWRGQSGSFKNPVEEHVSFACLERCSLSQIPVATPALLPIVTPDLALRRLTEKLRQCRGRSVVRESIEAERNARNIENVLLSLARRIGDIPWRWRPVVMPGARGGTLIGSQF